MADYFTHFSLVLPLQDASQQQYALDLAATAAAHRWPDSEQPAPADVPPELVDVLEDWSFETEAEDKHALWLHSDSGGIDAVCVFIKHLLQKFNPAGRVEFEWSHDCSKPRQDAYGGGAAVITARKIATVTTSEWLRRQAASKGKSTQPRNTTNNQEVTNDTKALPGASPGLPVT